MLTKMDYNFQCDLTNNQANNGGNIYFFKIQYGPTNSPNWSLYISIKSKLRECDKRSKHFPVGDYFINSHDLFS